MDNEVKKYVSLYKIVLDLSFNIYCSLINACIFSLKKGSPDMRDIVMLAINAILFYRRDLVQKLSHSCIESKCDTLPDICSPLLNALRIAYKICHRK